MTHIIPLALVVSAIAVAVPTTARAQQAATFTIEGLVLGPGDQNGLQWDGSGRVGQDQLDSIQSQIVTNAIGQVVSNANPAILVANAGLFLTAAPDATGTCTLHSALGEEDRRIATEDTYNPSSAGSGDTHIDVSWSVPSYVVGQAIMIECDLYDEDLASHDRIGRFVLDAQQLQAALDAGGRSVFFDTREETRNALLAVEVSAFGPMTPATDAPTTESTQEHDADSDGPKP